MCCSRCCRSADSDLTYDNRRGFKTRLDLRAYVLKVGEHLARPMEELAPLNWAAWLGRSVDELKDKRAAGADLRATGQKVPAHLREKPERTDAQVRGLASSVVVTARGWRFVLFGAFTRCPLWQGPSECELQSSWMFARCDGRATHQRLEHRALAAALASDDCNLRKVEVRSGNSSLCESQRIVHARIRVTSAGFVTSASDETSRMSSSRIQACCIISVTQLNA